MMISNVRYVVKAEYAERNQDHIRQVVKDLQALHRTDLAYSVFVEEDGKTFLHRLVCASDEARQAFTQLPAFQVFQKALVASQPEAAPVVTQLTLVGATKDLLP
jgi:hypothetical protein